VKLIRLVVDTTNFTGKTRFRGEDENLHLTERGSGPSSIRIQGGRPHCFHKALERQRPYDRQ
jgi:hypothetical protein